jgi:autoinducer 2-degrading protein
MTYVVCATWTAKVGEEDAVLEAVRKLAEASPAEPGMVLYQAHRDPQNPRVFFFYEQYVDEAAYAAHVESEHFNRWGFGEAIPRRLERRREFYETI